jgi:AraC-like DNA-binding protein
MTASGDHRGRAETPSELRRAGGDQTYRERRPVHGLGRHLSCVWVQEVSSRALPYAHRTVPNGGVELYCQVGSLPQLVGPQTGPTTEILAPGTTVVGVRFQPGAAPSVLGMPATELVDLAVGADEVLGDAAIALGERIAASASPQEAAAMLEREVLALAIEAQEPDPIATEAVRHLRPWQVSEVTSLTEALYISERQLRRRCLAAIGLAPKVLHRMMRFQGFLALAGQREHPSSELALLAAEAGYADQSHLTRESLRLSGLSPRALLLESEVHCGPAHDHAASYGPLLASRAT